MDGHSGNTAAEAWMFVCGASTVFSVLLLKLLNILLWVHAKQPRRWHPKNLLTDSAAGQSQTA